MLASTKHTGLLLAAFAAALTGSCRTAPTLDSSTKDLGSETPATTPPMPTDTLTLTAIAALNAIGATSPFVTAPTRCGAACHGAGPWHTTVDKQNVQKWGQKMQAVDDCIKEQVQPKDKLNCLRVTQADDAAWDGAKLGLYRAGVRTPEFKALFTTALGAADGETAWKTFSDAAIMPDKATDAEQMPDAQFAIVKNWVLGGMKNLDEAFGTTTVVPAAECKDEVTDELMEHIRQMKTNGWGWKNVNSDQISMFGCPERTGDYDELSSPLDCFQDDAKWPMAHQKDYATSWAERFNPAGGQITQRIRIIKELPFQSYFWMRSSADGRFAAGGLRGGPPEGGIIPENSRGFIVDLKDPNRPNIGTSGPYDPGFFPDNKGFTFMTGNAAWFCNQSLIEDPTTTFVDFASQSTYCGKGNLSVYQHVGAMLGGGDYFVVRSNNYSNDDGAYSVTRDPSVGAFATESATVMIYPMKESGTKFEVGQVVNINVPFEGDWGVVPSATLLTSRIAVKNGTSSIQQGYRLRKFDTTTKTSTPLGTICMKGGKATVSFNERVMAVHHYTVADDAKDLKMNPTDPKFKDLIQTSSNIWIYDMYTQQKMRLTRMNKGQFALYPHWRSDGWLYFVVRDTNTQKDYLVATDAGIRMQK